VPKPTAGIAIHAKASLRSEGGAAWGGAGVARASLGDGPCDDKYVSETFTIGGDDAEPAVAADEVGKGGETYAKLARLGLDDEAIDASAVVLGPDAPLSPEEIAHRRFVREQVEASRDKECGICMEAVLDKGHEFGLLDGCHHIFCVQCIREWRSVKTLDKQVKRSCPLCRESSNYVIPSSYLPPDDESKAEIIATYKARLNKIACRHFSFGQGVCPFGTSCFYEHRYRDGSLQQTTAPRLKMTEDGEVEAVRAMSLSDMLDLSTLQRPPARR